MTYSLDSIKKISSITSVTDALNLLQGGVTLLSNMDFSKKYLWDIKFLDILSHKLPSDFLKSFPIVDFDLEDAKLDTFSREFFMSTYKVPLKTSERTLKLTFYDNVNNDLFHWFKDWINIDILNNGNFISCINDRHSRKGTWSNGKTVSGKVEPIRKITISKLANNLKPITTQTLVIFPEGELVYNGASESNVNIYTMNFVIVDDGSKTTDSSAWQDTVKGALGISRNIFGTAGTTSAMDNILNIDSSKMDIGNFL